MRIVFITNNYTPYSGGVVSSINATTHELQQAGHTVYIITLDFLGDKHNDPAHVQRIPCPIKFIYKNNYMAIPWRPYKHVLNKIKKIQPDIIHAHHPFLLGKAALYAARKLSIPIFFTYHTLYEEYAHYIPLPQYITRPFVTKTVLSFCDAVDGIIAPSSAVLKYLQNKKINTPIVKIPSGLQKIYIEKNSTILRQAQDERGGGKQLFSKALVQKGEQKIYIQNQQVIDKLESRLCLFPTVRPELVEGCKIQKININKPFNLLFVGRFAKEKNITFLLDMFVHLQGNYKLTLVGYGPDFEKIKQYAFDQLCLSQDNVQFIYKPPKEKLPTLYVQADLFLFPSQTDTQGLVLAESMACGTPVVALDGPGQQDIIKQDENGFIVANKKEMIAAIEKIKNDVQLQQTLHKGALQIAQQYDQKKLINQLIDFYFTKKTGN